MNAPRESHDLTPLVNKARQKHDRGASTEELLRWMRDEGESPLGSMLVIQHLFNLSPSESKSLVWGSETWADKLAQHRELEREVDRTLGE
jgi:hypothetical protein